MTLSIRSSAAILALLALILAPLAVAEAPPGAQSCAGSSVAIPNDDNDDDDALQLTITGPCSQIVVGQTFSVTATWASEEQGYTIGSITVEHADGCTVLSSTEQISLNAHSGSAWLELQMDDDVCDLVFLVDATAGSILSPADVVYAYGSINVVAYQLLDLGQRSDRGLDEFWVPTLLLLAIAIGAALIGADFVFGFAMVGLVVQFFPSVGDAMPILRTWAWLLLGLALEYLLARSSTEGEGTLNDRK